MFVYPLITMNLGVVRVELVGTNHLITSVTDHNWSPKVTKNIVTSFPSNCVLWTWHIYRQFILLCAWMGYWGIRNCAQQESYSARQAGVEDVYQANNQELFIFLHSLQQWNVEFYEEKK